MSDFTQADLDRLADWDTPTICNGLEMLSDSARSGGFTIKQFNCMRPEVRMVGYARTATIRAAEKGGAGAPSRESYYEYIAAGPMPAIVVMQDLDHVPGAGAFWGEVNTNIHKGLGALGVITNGSVRDLDDCAEGFQALMGVVGPSHAWVHVTGFGAQVQVHGMTVGHGDIIHADRHGAVVVPPEAVTLLPGAIETIAKREAVILSAAKAPDFNIDRLKAAMKGAAEIH